MFFVYLTAVTAHPLMFIKLFSKSKPPPDDLELVRQYQRTGDMACLGDLFERHTELVYLVCMKYLKDEEESKDATMQIFENLVESLKRHEVNNFKGWLHITAKNHCLMLLRSHKSRKKAALKQEQPDAVEMATDLHLTEGEQQELALQALEKGLTSLPEEQRTCLELFYLQHKSYKAIAEETGCELSKVKSYIQNGKRNLKIYLSNEHE